MAHARLAPILLTLLVAPVLGGADGPPAPPAQPASPAPSAPAATPEKERTPAATRAATDAEAKALVDALAAAVRKKAPDVLQALTALDGLRHAEFLKPLVKLLAHADDDVALRAAAHLEDQKPSGADEKVVAKEVERVARDLWKSGYQLPVNGKRPVVRGATVRVLGAWAVPLEAKPFDEVKSLWAQEIADPDPRQSAALVHVIAYVEATKDKRFCRLLAEQIDEPTAASVHDAANPTAEYWEARWKVWKQLVDPAVAALKTLTGQTFSTTADAKQWFGANERTFGFHW
jgi:hypothetical protein